MSESTFAVQTVMVRHSDLHSTLHAKSLEEMYDRKEVEVQVSITVRTDQQVMYHCFQDPAASASRDDLTEFDLTIAHLRTKLANRKTSERAVKSELSLLSDASTTANVHATCGALQIQTEGLCERLG
jgi:hypothetical protein